MADPAPILREPAFARFWFARIFSSTSFQMLSVAIGWQMYALTGRAFDLGLVGLVQFAPMVLLTLYVGHVADRVDRRRIAMVCQVLEGGVALCFAAATLSGRLDRNSILVLAAILGGCRAFESPSLSALVSNLVPRPLLPRATAWSAAANQTAQIVGPSLGGLLYAVGPTVVHGVAAIAFLSASACLAGIPRQPAIRNADPGSLFSGIGFVLSHPVLLGTISLDLFAVLLGGATALLPIFADTVLHTGPWGLGILRAAPAVGALGMSAVLVRRPLGDRCGPILFGAITLFGAATMVFALSTSLALSLAALATLGAADVISVVIRMSLVQLETPDVMRGRVSAVNALFIGTSNQLGEFESGMLAAWIGAVPATLLGGVGTILVGAAWAVIFPSLRRLRRLPQS